MAMIVDTQTALPRRSHVGRQTRTWKIMFAYDTEREAQRPERPEWGNVPFGARPIGLRLGHRYTYCLLKLEMAPDNRPAFLGVTHAACAPGDRFVRATGRKMAFYRMLASIGPLNQPDDPGILHADAPGWIDKGEFKHGLWRYGRGERESLDLLSCIGRTVWSRRNTDDAMRKGWKRWRQRMPFLNAKKPLPSHMVYQCQRPVWMLSGEDVVLPGPPRIHLEDLTS